MIVTKWKWNDHKFDMKKFQNWEVGALVLWRSFWFDRKITNFSVWKLTNFDEWKCVSHLWELNSFNLCFSHSKVYIRWWYSWLFSCVWTCFASWTIIDLQCILNFDNFWNSLKRFSDFFWNFRDNMSKIC
jgi:hypothetical protein